MLSGEMNARMSCEMETLMDVMHTQISRALSSAISERIIPEIQNTIENLPFNQRGVEPCTSINEDRVGNVWKNANTKLAKKDSKSACELTDHTDNVPYKYAISQKLLVRQKTSLDHFCSLGIVL